MPAVARDRPDLIQTVSVPDKGLTRPPKKIQNLKSSKKTKKCQPRDRPDLIQTVSVPDKGLARPPKKINRRKNWKNKSKYSSIHEGLAVAFASTKYQNSK